MNIRNARHIANLVNNNRFNGSHDRIRASFQRLHMSADRGNRNDRALAQILWDCAGSWDNQGDLKPVEGGHTALLQAMADGTISCPPPNSATSATRWASPRRGSRACCKSTRAAPCAAGRLATEISLAPCACSCSY